MNTSVHLAVYPDTLWLCPSGEVDSSNVVLLEEAFWMARNYANPETYLDCKELTFISSAGLGQIIHAINSLKAVGSTLVIGRLNETVKLALGALGLHRFVRMEDRPKPQELDLEAVGIIVNSDLRELKSVRTFLETSFSRIRYDDVSAYGLKMAVDELVSNVIRHNYNGTTGKPVSVMLSRQDDTLEASVIDQGFAFDPTRYEGRAFDKTIAGGYSGGMGINLVRALADSFEYETRDGHNLTQVRKSFDRAIRQKLL